MNATQLNLGYMYTFSNEDNNFTFYKEHNVYFVKGFRGSQYINVSFSTFLPAKKEFNKLTKN